MAGRSFCSLPCGDIRGFWGHSEGPQGCSITAWILCTTARPATPQRKFPAASPVAAPESPSRHGRPVPPRLLMQGPHKHILHHCRAPKQVSAFQPASQTRHPPGQLCCAYTDMNPRGSPVSVRPGFWEAPVVQKSPHGRVRGLTRENTYDQRLSPLKRRSRPCPAQETSPRWSFGKGLLGRAESSLTSRLTPLLASTATAVHSDSSGRPEAS